MAKFAIIIPSRLAAVRLPNKPLLEINGVSMIKRVVQQAKKAMQGDVYVAAGDQEIVDELANEQGVTCILTDKSLPSGTDRVYEAFTKLPNAQEYDYIINLQGDMPFIQPSTIASVMEYANIHGGDVITPVFEYPYSTRQTVDEMVNADSVVKVIRKESGEAIYFTRALCPTGSGPYYLHLGLYCYAKDVLKEYASLKQTPLELRERLEQLRFIEHGYKISTVVVDEYPVSVDTQEDFQLACNIALNFT